MFKRNIDKELAMYDIEEGRAINGLIILILLKFMPKCSLKQLACALYLVRFTKILSKLLDEDDRIQYLSGIPEWELGNLDILLSPYILQKYDYRFIRGIKELLAKNIISFDGDHVYSKITVDLSLENDSIRRIYHKAFYSSKVVMNTDISKLDDKIYQIIGEEQWQNLYSSIELR